MDDNYKKNRDRKLQIFCLVVENDSSITKAAQIIGRDETNIGRWIKSLEADVGFALFKRNGIRKILTEQGKQYYTNIAKPVVDSMVDAFGGEKVAAIVDFFEPTENQSDKFLKTTIDKVNTAIQVTTDSANNIQEKISHLSKIIDNKFIKSIPAKIAGIKKYIIFAILGLILILASIGSAYQYNKLVKKNYFFDKDLYENASPLLQNLMIHGDYTISEDAICPFGITQLNLDMYEMVSKLTKKYKDLSVVMYLISDSPLISMRFTGDEKIDKVFKDLDLFTCNANKTYIYGQKQFANATELFKQNKNFKIYNMYYDAINTCQNCNYFLENIKKYPNNLFGDKISKTEDSESYRGWIIKYNNYYYLLSMNNIISMKYANNISNKQRKHKRYIVWKKLTEDRLKQYNSGEYYNMILRYNIRFS